MCKPGKFRLETCKKQMLVLAERLEFLLFLVVLLHSFSVFSAS